MRNNKVIKVLKKCIMIRKKMTNYYTKGFDESTKVLIYFLTIRSRNIIIFKIVFFYSDFGSPEKNINKLTFENNDFFLYEGAEFNCQGILSSGENCDNISIVNNRITHNKNSFPVLIKGNINNLKFNNNTIKSSHKKDIVLYLGENVEVKHNKIEGNQGKYKLISPSKKIKNGVHSNVGEIKEIIKQ